MSYTICIVICEHLTNHYMSPMVRGMLRAAEARGYKVLIYSPLDINVQRNQMTLAHVQHMPHHVDGFILPNFAGEDVFRYCELHGAPILLYAGTKAGRYSIGPDNYQGARDAVEHLIRLGRRRIVHLRGIPLSSEAQIRFQAYRDALEHAGLPYDEALVIEGKFRRGDGQIAVTNLIQEGIPFDAIFAANDLSAQGAMTALQQANINIPYDVALVGFDDVEAAARLRPSLSTVRQSAFQIGWEAISVITGLIEGKPTPEETIVPTRLIIRDSCGSHNEEPMGTTNWVESFSLLFGQGYGQIIDVKDVKSILDPFFDSYNSPHQWMGHVVIATNYIIQRDWYIHGFYDFLTFWRQTLLQRGEPTKKIDQLFNQGRDYVHRVVDDLQSTERRERLDRLTALNYVIDLLNISPPDQMLEQAIRYFIHTGAHGGFTLAPIARSTHYYAVCYRDTGEQWVWQGDLVNFPPPHWLEGGETMVTAPLSGSTTSGLIGIIERDARSYIELDDLLLRSVNTYRAMVRLHETLHELEIARSVQMSLLPRVMPKYKNLDIAASAYAAKQVGGDLYGAYTRPDGSLAIAIGDVIGKGMPAALLMSSCVTTLAGTIQIGLSPAATLNRMHDVLQPFLGNGQQAGICLIFLDPEKADADNTDFSIGIQAANAGMIAPIIKTGDSTQLLELYGLPLGSPLTSQTPYQELHFQLHPGDLFVMGSDGIVEAMNTQNEMYGFERLLQIIQTCQTNQAEAVLNAILNDVLTFVGEAEQHDDIAIVVLCCRTPSS